MCKNLWPDIKQLTTETPLTILKQQAEYLERSTEGKIVGCVETSEGSNYEYKRDLLNAPKKTNNDLCHQLFITVPSLGDVRFLLVSLLQNPIQPFPCHLKDEINEKEYNSIENNERFIAKLEEILKSEKIMILLSNLL